ncbi:hypothetical protein pdam_00000843 [Pocillopora damicornis]|uniref:XPA C-terminal domain-containing protein n=1 Tax=Pocillopora damicornis TaxID=46731 RepID=A0A3M6TVC1_POCDA|nr:hypothetical protein pdam_00000843 [Pocillopora damicornis]
MLRTADYNGLAVGTSCMGTAKHNVQDGERLIWRNLPTKIDDLNMAERKLTDAQKARIERNRQRALMLRNARLSNRPYPEMKLRDGDASKANSSSEAPATISRVVDTGGGFLLDPEEDESQGERNNLVREPAPILYGDQLHCLECQKEFLTSYIYKYFEVYVCDKCRDPDEKHSLITKTEAKEIVERAFEVWGGEDGLEEARQGRAEKREVQKQRKFDKKVKELRRAVRTSTWKKDTSRHQHQFEEEEEYNEETDEWTKTCKTCGYQLTYEKM